MEISSQQLLLDDSFSCAWLLSVKSSSAAAAAAAAAAALGDSHRSFDTGSFIEIDPNLVPSPRWTTATAADTELPRRQSLADEILPRHHPAAAASNSALLRKSQSVNSNRYQGGGGGGASTTSSPLFHSAKSSPGSPAPPRTGRSGLDSRLAMSSCAKSPTKLICKYFRFLMPLRKIAKNLRLLPSSPSSSSSFSSKSTASSYSLARSSPRSSVDWCRNNADISISDAILHCKNSIVSCSTTPAAALREEQPVTAEDD